MTWRPAFFPVLTVELVGRAEAQGSIVHAYAPG
jgi:hypothetical protein